MKYKNLNIKENLHFAPKLLKNYATSYLTLVTDHKLDIVRVTLPIKFVSILNPKYAGHVLEDNYKNYIKSKMYKPFKPILGEGLVTAEGDNWKRQRRMVSPSLTQKKIQNLLPIIVKNTESLMEKWAEKCITRNIEVSKDVMGLTLDIFCEIFFGKALKDRGQVLGKELIKCFEISTEKALNPLSPPFFIPTKQNREFKKSIKIIQDTCLEFVTMAQKGEIEESYLLTKMVNALDEDGSKLSTQQLIDQVATLIFAGYETTSLTICWTLYLLSKNPEVLKKLQAEVDQVIENDGADINLTKDLKYTTMVLKESMRLYPAVPSVSREALSDDEIGGIKIKKGEIVAINPCVYHRHPEYWDNPNEFQPERFLQPLKHKHAFIPFISGPRACVGEHLAWLEGTWILALIAKNFDLEKVTDKEMESKPVATLTMAEPFYLKLTKRASIQPRPDTVNAPIENPKTVSP
jgi:cytochrome P450